jgi:class 3 adenylate cyclase
VPDADRLTVQEALTWQADGMDRLGRPHDGSEFDLSPEWQCPSCRGSNPPGTRFCGHCGVTRTAADGSAARPNLGSEADEATDRRLITALFADVSGFTALADALDPEHLVEIIGPILATIAEIVARYGGRVNKFAGDAILALFGTPVAHEDDAVRALLAARAMHHEVGRLIATLPPQGRHLQLHMGVNTGRVVTGQPGAVLGDAVNVAQRLEAASPAGEVYVGEASYLLARHAMTFEDVGALAVKGKAEPVHAWRLVLDSVPVFPSTSPTAASIVGRDEELAELRNALTKASCRDLGVIGIIGEPGVGKSRCSMRHERSPMAGACVGSRSDACRMAPARRTSRTSTCSVRR